MVIAASAAAAASIGSTATSDTPGIGGPGLGPTQPSSATPTDASLLLDRGTAQSSAAAATEEATG